MALHPKGGEKKDIDAVLVGADNPEYKKTQHYKTVLHNLKNKDYNHPILKELMTEPIPEELQALEPAIVFQV